MIKMNILRNRPIISAAIAMIFLMFLFGLSHRILADRLLSSVEMPPIDPNALAEFPMEIGMWTGQEIPLDEAIIEATDTDAHINRNYIRNNGIESVGLYVAFGQRARDLIPHRPEVCYIGNGWTLGSRQTEELSLEDGTKLPCTIMQFSRGSLIQNKIMILDYYIIEGKLCKDVSLLRSKIWRGSGAVNYIAQIQISVPVLSSQDSESAKETISAFAIESAPFLMKLLAGFNIDESATMENTDGNSISREAGSD